MSVNGVSARACMYVSVSLWRYMCVILRVCMSVSWAVCGGVCDCRYVTLCAVDLPSAPRQDFSYLSVRHGH